MYSIFNRAPAKSIEASFQDVARLAMEFFESGYGEKIFRPAVRLIDDLWQLAEHRRHDEKALGETLSQLHLQQMSCAPAEGWSVIFRHSEADGQKLLLAVSTLETRFVDRPKLRAEHKDTQREAACRLSPLPARQPH